jgi:hypothetical protein
MFKNLHELPLGVQSDISCHNGIATLHYRIAVYGKNIFACNCKKITNNTLTFWHQNLAFKF